MKACPDCDSKTREIHRLVKAIRDQADEHAEEARKLRELIQALRSANDGYRGILHVSVPAQSYSSPAVHNE